MISDSIIAIIPARAGSKGLKNKNLLELNGASITELAVSQGEAIAEFVFLSTDINKFHTITTAKNTQVHQRNQELSSDNAKMDDVIMDVIKTYDIVNCSVVLLQPTSPMRSIDTIINALKCYSESDCELYMSVCETSDNGFKYGTISEQNFFAMNQQKDLFENRQNLPKTYKPNGAIYIFNSDRFLRDNTIATDNIKCLEMTKMESIDIDSLSDYELVKRIYEC